MNKHRAQIPQIFGIIGEAVNHSLSPLIHNYCFRRAGLTAMYTAFPIKKNNLEPAIEGLRVLDIRGINVTNPYKEQVIPLLDDLALSARWVGAVNTIKNTDGRLIGHNTDVFGIKAVLQDQIRQVLHDRDIVLLGSGGAARACLIALLGQRVSAIIIFARHPQKARRMVKTIQSQPTKIPVTIKSWRQLDRTIATAAPALIVNATSIPPQQMGTILRRLAKSANRQQLTFLDINYGLRAITPRQRPVSIRYIDGLYMLAAQAVESFRIWTGRRMEIKVIYRYIRRKLQECL